MYKDFDINGLYKYYFEISEAIDRELEEEEFGNGCNEIHLDNLYERQREVKAEILKRRNRRG